MTYVTCVNTDCFWPTKPAISECVFTYISADVVVSDEYLPVPYGTLPGKYACYQNKRLCYRRILPWHTSV